MLKAELKNGNLILSIPVNDAKDLPLSTTGKTLIVASTHGNIPTPVTVNGQPLVVSINAYIKNGDAPKNAKTPIAGRFGRPEGVTA